MTDETPGAATSEKEAKLHFAEAEASLLLVESLMLVLAERGVLSREQIIDAVETAIATKKTFVEEGVHPEISAIAAGTLSRIANSLAASSRPK